MNFAEIPKLIEQFFISLEIDQRLNRFSFFLIRHDGVILYQNKKEMKINAHSVGALLSGVWQASAALAEFIPGKKAEQEFRMSFDTSSEGIYIVPVDTNLDKLYLGLIYYGEVNPGLLKSKMRDISTSLSQYLGMERFDQVKEIKIASKNRDEKLFGDITDAEMDHIFSFAKN